MARTHREWMDSLPEGRRARILAEAARIEAEIDARATERQVIRETAKAVHHAMQTGLFESVTIKPAWSGEPVTIRRTRDVLKLRRRTAA